VIDIVAIKVVMGVAFVGWLDIFFFLTRVKDLFFDLRPMSQSIGRV
jgi:hypothetical protein